MPTTNDCTKDYQYLIIDKAKEEPIPPTVLYITLTSKPENKRKSMCLIIQSFNATNEAT